MADQTGQGGFESGMAGTAGTPADPVAQFRQWMMAQQQGSQSMQPSMQRRQAEPVQQRTDRPTDYGARTEGYAGRQTLKDFTNSLSNTLGQVGQIIQRRKQMENDQVFDRFVNARAGIDEADVMIQQAQQSIQQNPQDQEAIARLRQAQQAKDQNRTILEAMFSGPKGEKHSKLLGKGFGIDDKNAGTPERQSAIKAAMQRYGVGQRAGNVLSQIPQRMQPTPGTQQIKPPTGGELLRAGTAERGQDIKATTDALRMANQRGMSLDHLRMTGQLKGIQVSRDPNTGELVTHIMSPEERAKVPYLKSQDDLQSARSEALRAAADAKMNPNNPELRIKAMNAQSMAVDAQARMLAAQAAQMRAMTAQAKEPPEVAKARKDADDAESQWNVAQARLKNRTAVSDQGMVMAWVRAQVPRTTWTEIEFALKAGSAPERLQRAYDKVASGKYDDKYINELASDIEQVYKAKRQTADKYSKVAGEAAAGALSDEDILQQLNELK